MSAPDYRLARVWLARSLAATGPALRVLAGDPAMQSAVPKPPTADELNAAAAVVERVAICLAWMPVEETAP